MDIKANNLILFKESKLPKSKIYLDKVINYINEEINPLFIKNAYFAQKKLQQKRKYR